MTAIPVLQTRSVTTGDLVRVGAPLVDVVVEPVVGTLREGVITVLMRD